MNKEVFFEEIPAGPFSQRQHGPCIKLSVPVTQKDGVSDFEFNAVRSRDGELLLLAPNSIVHVEY